ncbi:hypothetical protein QZH41_017325 [Actinostola sp. cb2023]|nr:hypothetical protein QZH41_017325 [Actinostola sp. cb2023]
MQSTVTSGKLLIRLLENYITEGRICNERNRTFQINVHCCLLQLNGLKEITGKVAPI